MKKKSRQALILTFSLILGWLVLPQMILPVWAAEVAPGVEVYEVNFDGGLIAKGYTVASPNNDFRLGIFPNVLSAPTDFILKKRVIVDQPVPEGKTVLSDYWEFDIANKAAYDGRQAIVVQLQYQPNVDLKKVVYWNGAEWQELPSQVIDPQQRIIRAYFHLPYARFLVWSENQLMSEGAASWYRYKDCDCAASPDYPKGSIVKVTNVANGQAVKVKINDYGPDRSIHPDRVIDLDVTAFKQIANKRDGLVQVLVEPVKIH